MNSVYDYLNLAARSPQGCINKGERVNKLEVSECFELFNAFRDLSQTSSPQTLATLCVFLPFFVFPVRSSVPQRIKAVIKQRGITRRQAREVMHQWSTSEKLLLFTAPRGRSHMIFLSLCTHKRLHYGGSMVQSRWCNDRLHARCSIKWWCKASHDCYRNDVTTGFMWCNPNS